MRKPRIRTYESQRHEPGRQADHRRLLNRVQILEDQFAGLYDIINDLRNRVYQLEHSQRHEKIELEDQDQDVRNPGHIRDDRRYR
jgi:hypothetical protein